MQKKELSVLLELQLLQHELPLSLWRACGFRVLKSYRYVQPIRGRVLFYLVFPMSATAFWFVTMFCLFVRSFVCLFVFLLSRNVSITICMLMSEMYRLLTAWNALYILLDVAHYDSKRFKPICFPVFPNQQVVIYGFPPHPLLRFGPMVLSHG